MNNETVVKSKRGRAAAAWACQIAETICQKLDEAGGVSALPMEIPWLEVQLSGQAIRIAQEVNLAKKQLNAREENKKRMREIEQELRAKGKGEIPEDYIPRLHVWALKTRDLVKGEKGTPLPGEIFQHRKVFYIDYMTGNKKPEGKMDKLAWDFMERANALPKAAAPSLGRDAYEVYAKLSGTPEPEPPPTRSHAPKAPETEPLQADPQEELLAGYLKGDSV